MQDSLAWLIRVCLLTWLWPVVSACVTWFILQTIPCASPPLYCFKASWGCWAELNTPWELHNRVGVRPSPLVAKTENDCCLLTFARLLLHHSSHCNTLLPWKIKHSSFKALRAMILNELHRLGCQCIFYSIAVCLVIIPLCFASASSSLACRFSCSFPVVIGLLHAYVLNLDAMQIQ